MSMLAIGFLLIIAIIWFLNSFVTASMIAMEREEGKSFILAWLKGFAIAQIPVAHQMAIFASVWTRLKTNNKVSSVKEGAE